MHQPKISIITITYNAERWLERTILSVLTQSYTHIEYIIIDGQSKDKTVDIIRQYEAGVSYWISEPDNGLYDAMNKGMRHATGDYVWFMNAGDTIYTADTVQKMVDKIKKKVSLPDIIYGETMIVDSDNRPVGRRRLKAPKRLTWKSFKMGMLVCHQSFLVKREIATPYDTAYRHVADFDWCIRSMKQAQRIQNSGLVLSNYMEGGMSAIHRKASLKERYAVMSHYYGKVYTFLIHGWFALRFYWAKWVKGRV
ncbi:glycosyltransferase [Parabacteroides sp. OttesenSCG-928-N08]|nr:glycosyltransferase [Parabacteroides sp. OttesenSCG-928-N08]